MSLGSILRPVEQKLHKQPEHFVIPADHISICDPLKEAQALCAPAQVLAGVVGDGERSQCKCVELIAEERKVLAIRDDSLGYKRPAQVLLAPEPWRENQIS